MTISKSYRYDEMNGVRTDALFGLFNNFHRAKIVETNDPLNMGRIRFKCPEMHDENLKKDDCPWALPDHSFGGPKSGEWHVPCIGDIVFISFEEGHPYSPIWTSAADPTRREHYTLPSIHTPTPLPVDDRGNPAEHPNDYDVEYLPKDNRPMSHGVVDRYGHLDMLGSVGFFPVEHKDAPPESDYDAIQKKNFTQSQKSPEVNNPDSKFMVRMSKYGHIMISADQGYWWNRDDSDSELGEFYGDFEKDKEWEISRWRYMRDLLHEGEPNGNDQRRLLFSTRYGHKIEMRDVGWAQKGPIKSHTRDGEFAEPRVISKEEKLDFRWIKFRTKAGMLFQMYDKGSHQEDDEFIKRLLKEETGDKTEQEDLYWGNKDGRFIRLITRYGFKFVLDDRGSHDKSAEKNENPRGNGILMKGRRTGGTKSRVMSGKDISNPTGFYWEFNENDSTNMTTWGTPVGSTMQMSDKLQYIMIAIARRDYARPWKKHKENEFLLEPLSSDDAENATHHLKLDHDNEYLRLKTRSGFGAKPLDGYDVGEFVNEAENGEQQGMECRDGKNGDGPWTELVDIDRRGVWFSRKFKMSVFRARTTESGHSNMLMWCDENKAEYVLRNNESGYFVPPPEGSPSGTVPTFVSSRIQIFCQKDVEIISQEGKINIKAGGDISIQSDTKISMRGGNAKFELSGSNSKFSDQPMMPGFIDQRSSISLPPSPEIITLPKIQPIDRGKRYNEELESAADLDEIEHPIDDK